MSPLLCCMLAKECKSYSFKNLISHKKDLRIRYPEAGFVGVCGKPDLMELAAASAATGMIMMMKSV